MTSAPIKQGGLAAQQTVAATTAIAFAAGADVAPKPYEPVLRALLLTGETPRWLRAHGDASEMTSGDAPWWPPHKIATHYLAPYLGAEGRSVAVVRQRDRIRPRLSVRSFRATVFGAPRSSWPLRFHTVPRDRSRGRLRTDREGARW
jgi:hypothetical protein